MRRGWGRTGRRELRGPTGGAVPVGEQGQGVGTGPLDLAGKLHGGRSGMGWPPSLLGSRTPTPPPGGGLQRCSQTHWHRAGGDAGAVSFPEGRAVPPSCRPGQNGPLFCCFVTHDSAMRRLMQPGAAEPGSSVRSSESRPGLPLRKKQLGTQPRLAGLQAQPLRRLSSA